MKNHADDIRAYNYTVCTGEAGTRFDVFLAASSGLSRSHIKKIIVDGYAAVNNTVMLKPSYHVETGDSIEITIPREDEPDFLPENIPLDIIFQDEHIIVINKPAGMVVHPGRGNFTGTLASALLYHCKTVEGVGDSKRPGIVHRLDKDTSGLIVAALTHESHRLLSQMIHDHEVEKVYIAFVWGHPHPSSGTIDAPMGRHPRKGILRAVVEGGKPAVTHYEVTASYEFLSQLAIRLETGRTHQIRVHLVYKGHPVFGDPMYGGREKLLKGFSPEVREKARKLLKNLDRQALHAVKLDFNHPITGDKLSFNVPLPDDLSELMSGLEEM